ncbi:MAG TPA: EF-hand domain-containing protein [Rhizomicrobium sp.]|nr:EF-hand domain-containing protein [Rhizomicrobium sp.]
MRFIVIIPFIILTTSGCVGMAVRAVAQPSKPDLSRMLEKADANGDGVITKAEFTDARAKLFDRLDRNHDGYLSKDDKPRFSLGRGGNGDRLQQMILIFDKDGDGKISRDEFVNGPSFLFDRADTNHDGVVDAGELAAFRSRMAARKSN